LKHFGAPLLIAGSFNETYKRNALNNGVIAVECESLVRALQAARARGAKTWRLPSPLRVDFRRAVIEYDGVEHAFGVPAKWRSNWWCVADLRR
jgi:homoaconitate hydratase